MAEGFTLMIVGMIVVFAFLMMLVYCIGLSAAFFTKYAHLFPDPVPATAKKAAAKPAASDDSDVAVAIAAVTAFIKK